MKPKSFLSLLMLSVLFIAPQLVHARRRTDDISIHQLPSPAIMGSGNSVHGYVECRFMLRNSSLSKSHEVEIFLPGNSHGVGRDQIKYCGKTIEMMPDSKAVVTLFVNCGLAGSSGGIRVDGGEKKTFHMDYLNHQPGYIYGSEEGCVMVSRSTPKWFNDKIEKQNRTLFRGENIHSWSPNWLGYTRFDAIVITAEELRNCPGNVLQALGRYVRCGGILSIINDEGEVDKTLAKIATSRSDRNYAFGEVVMINARDKDTSRLERSLAHSRKIWDEGSPEKVNKSFPIFDKLRIPMRGMLSLVIVFAVIVGPVNIWWLSRKRKRIWMLWVIPLASLMMCGVVFGYSIVAEGWRATSRVDVITILDQGKNEATSIGWIGYYSPLTPGSGLHFSQQTEITPILERDTFKMAGKDKTINWTHDQHLDSGWVAARVPTFFMVRKPQTRRERLSFTQSNGEVKIVNGLGSDIEKLVYMDDEGKFWWAPNIAAGANVKLQFTGKTAGKGRPKQFRRVYTRKWFKNDLDKNFKKFLTPGTYVAIMNNCDFVNEGLDNLKDRNCRNIVYGIIGRENK